VTKGKEPERWQLTMRALWQPTAQEEAELRNKQAQTDIAYIGSGVITPEEVAVSRFGGAEWRMETIVDFDGRAQMANVGPDPAKLAAGEPVQVGEKMLVPAGPPKDQSGSPIGSEEPPRKPDLKTSSVGDPSYESPNATERAPAQPEGKRDGEMHYRILRRDGAYVMRVSRWDAASATWVEEDCQRNPDGTFSGVT
jgi:hypothetical protein